MKKIIVLCLTVLTVAHAALVGAAPLKVFVAEITVIGASNRDETQVTIKTLLTSRLNRGTVTTVATAAEADAVVSGSYIAAGKMFSLDAVATAGGRTLTRAFVEGDLDSGLIPAINKLAEKLAGEMGSVPAVAPAVAAMPVAPVIAATEVIVAEKGAPGGEIVPIIEKTKGNLSSWRSQPIAGVLNLVAAGGINVDGSRDVFLAESHRLLHYRHGTAFQLVSEMDLKVYENIISLDVLDSGDGTYELYETVVANEQPASKIWRVTGNTMQLLAENVPYYFRVMALSGSAKKLYVQKSGGDQFFAGDLFEAVRQGAEIKLKTQVALPRFASIYTFNQFTDTGGKLYTVTFSPENKLVVYDSALAEIWRSSDTYGGSEQFLEKKTLVGGGAGDPLQVFMNQRILVTPEGNVLVGKNEAFWLLGKKGYYSSGSVYCLSWNGDHLEGKWHTRVADNYMPGYAYDEKARVLLQLEMVARPHVFSRGSSVLTVRKID